MDSSPVSPRLAFIQLHPIKALDSVHVKEARIGPGGGLELDRAWALYSADGQWVNGKRTPAVHLIRAAYAPDLTAVTLSVPGDRRGVPTSTFAFPADTAGAAEWFSAYFEQQINIRYSLEGFPDDSIANGPTIVSAASLDVVSTWFPGLTAGDVRLRFRTTLEIDGVPAFWEDQLFGEEARYAVRICHPGRQRRASTIFTGWPQTPASLPANQVKSCASAIHFFWIRLRRMAG